MDEDENPTTAFKIWAAVFLTLVAFTIVLILGAFIETVRN